MENTKKQQFAINWLNWEGNTSPEEREGIREMVGSLKDLIRSMSGVTHSFQGLFEVHHRSIVMTLRVSSRKLQQEFTFEELTMDLSDLDRQKWQTKIGSPEEAQINRAIAERIDGFIEKVTRLRDFLRE